MRFEATDTTIWFGFEDDIVVRVTPTGGASRIDVRSVSRLGKAISAKVPRAFEHTYDGSGNALAIAVALTVRPVATESWNSYRKKSGV